MNPSASLTANMTTSIIQDYVPDTYSNDRPLHDNKKGKSSHEHQSSPINGAPVSHEAVENRNQTWDHEEGAGSTSRLGVALHKPALNSDAIIRPSEAVDSSMGFKPDVDKEDSSIGDAEGGLGLGLMNWPSPGQGHGYGAKDVNKVKWQGPAPFLTPGPHRHKLVPSPSQG